MLEQIKNMPKRNKFKKLVMFLAGPEVIAAGGALAPQKDVDELNKLAPGSLIVSGAANADGNVNVTLSTDLLAQAQAAAATPEAPKAAPQAIVIEKGRPVPAKAPRAAKASVYPFATMEVNDSFVVAATTDKPNPAKSLASTIGSANKRFAEKTGETHKNRKGKDVPTLKLTRKFEVFAITAGKDGETVNGARIFRTL